MMDSEAGIRLSKHSKLGILRIFFSRFILILLFLVVQVFLYFTLFGWLEKFIPYYTVLEIIFAYAMVIYLFNNRMDASAKLTWLAVIALVPLFGVALLAFTTSNIGHRKTRKRVEEMIELSEGAVPQNSEVIEKLKGDPYGTDDLVKYLDRSGDFPIFTNTEVTYFPLGEDKFKALLEELEKAEKFIFLEYFIIE
jgi:cardiolipin synthase